LSLNIGPHDFDCTCERCSTRREANKAAWSNLSESDRARNIQLLADELEEFALREVTAGRAEIVGKNDKAHNLYRFKEDVGDSL